MHRHHFCRRDPSAIFTFLCVSIRPLEQQRSGASVENRVATSNVDVLVFTVAGDQFVLHA
jgi:hypothetical protein